MNFIVWFNFLRKSMKILCLGNDIILNIIEFSSNRRNMRQVCNYFYNLEKDANINIVWVLKNERSIPKFVKNLVYFGSKEITLHEDIVSLTLSPEYECSIDLPRSIRRISLGNAIVRKPICENLEYICFNGNRQVSNNISFPEKLNHLGINYKNLKVIDIPQSVKKLTLFRNEYNYNDFDVRYDEYNYDDVDLSENKYNNVEELEISSCVKKFPKNLKKLICRKAIQYFCSDSDSNKNELVIPNSVVELHLLFECCIDSIIIPDIDLILVIDMRVLKRKYMCDGMKKNSVMFKNLNLSRTKIKIIPDPIDILNKISYENKKVIMIDKDGLVTFEVVNYSKINKGDYYSEFECPLIFKLNT